MVYDKEYYQKHKEQIKENQRKYNQKHKEQIKENQRKYREKLAKRTAKNLNVSKMEAPAKPFWKKLLGKLLGKNF